MPIESQLDCRESNEFPSRPTSDVLSNADLVIHSDLGKSVTTSKGALRRELCQLAYQIYERRRIRERVLGRKLFGEPAWDMLLALYCLPTRGEALRPTALSHAACVPVATGMRWQLLLAKEGLIERAPPELPSRRRFVRLTANGRDLIERYLARILSLKIPRPLYPDRAGG